MLSAHVQRAAESMRNFGHEAIDHCSACICGRQRTASLRRAMIEFDQADEPGRFQRTAGVSTILRYSIAV